MLSKHHNSEFLSKDGTDSALFKHQQLWSQVSSLNKTCNSKLSYTSSFKRVKFILGVELHFDKIQNFIQKIQKSCFIRPASVSLLQLCP